MSPPSKNISNDMTFIVLLVRYSFNFAYKKCTVIFKWHKRAVTKQKCEKSGVRAEFFFF